jgi:hypothetical protein
MLPDSGSAELIAIGVVAVLGLIMRWVFRPSRGRAALRRVPVDAADAAASKSLGLLSVLTTLPRQEALGVRERLQTGGIRSSMSRRHDGRFDVLVFHGDVDRARVYLGP